MLKEFYQLAQEIAFNTNMDLGVKAQCDGLFWMSQFWFSWVSQVLF
jgi:hypothetical protein